MNHYSKWVEELVSEYEKTINKLNNSYVNLYQRINPEEVEDWSPIRSDRQAINTLLLTVTETMQNCRTYRDVVENLNGFSKHINRAAERQVKALDSMITNFTHIESFCLRCLQIIDEKLAQTGVERESGGEE
jgi:leucyl-tRNA synthetase